MPCDVCIVWERCGRVSRGSVLSVHVLYMFAYLFVFSPGWESADVILTGKGILTDSVGLEAHLGVREEGREQQTGKTCKWGLQKVSYHDKQWSLKLALGSFWEQRQEESFSHLNNSCPKPDVVLEICTVCYTVWCNMCVFAGASEPSGELRRAEALGRASLLPTGQPQVQSHPGAAFPGLLLQSGRDAAQVTNGPDDL